MAFLVMRRFHQKMTEAEETELPIAVSVAVPPLDEGIDLSMRRHYPFLPPRAIMLALNASRLSFPFVVSL